MPNRNIFFDLDGTLIDVKTRLYKLFAELAPQNQLSLDEYWEIKRGRIDQVNLLRNYLRYSEEQIAAFKSLWLSKIEEKDRLAQDVPFLKSGMLLKDLSIDNYLYIVTNRQNRRLAIEQINGYGWAGYVKEVLVTEQTTSKFSLIKERVKTNKEDALVGDTGEDVLTGKKLGVKTIAVASGFLSKKILLEYNPDLIVNSIEDIYIDNAVLLR